MVSIRHLFFIGATIATVLVVIQLAVSGQEDYYELLDIKKTASGREIKKAFHKFSLKYHPDKNKDPNAESNFRKIAQAYSVLSDPEKRKMYDQFGHKTFSEGRHEQEFNFDVKEFFKNFDGLFNHQQEGDSQFGNFPFGGSFFATDEQPRRTVHSSGRTCRTFTRQSGNSFYYHTECS